MTPKPRPISLTERDRVLLDALAEQRLAVLPQAACWLGVTEATAAKRLRRLREAKLVEFERRFDRGAPMVRITGEGLKRIGSTLGKPGEKLDEYRHDVGVGWVWTAAREGVFGEMTEIISERGMRSHDARLDRLEFGDRLVSDDQTLAVDLGLPSIDGRSGRHYPDLLMRSRGQNTIAVELELTAKGRRRLDHVMDAYASDQRIDAVLYLVPDERAGATVRRAAARAGITDKVHVRQLAPGGIPGVDIGVRQPERMRAKATKRVSSRDAPTVGQATAGPAR